MFNNWSRLQNQLIKDLEMTIAAAWVRTLRNCKELIVVSDSRLNGGMKMDCG